MNNKRIIFQLFYFCVCCFFPLRSSSLLCADLLWLYTCEREKKKYTRKSRFHETSQPTTATLEIRAIYMGLLWWCFNSAWNKKCIIRFVHTNRVYLLFSFPKLAIWVSLGELRQEKKCVWSKDVYRTRHSLSLLQGGSENANISILHLRNFAAKDNHVLSGGWNPLLSFFFIPARYLCRQVAEKREKMSILSKLERFARHNMWCDMWFVSLNISFFFATSIIYFARSRIRRQTDTVRLLASSLYNQKWSICAHHRSMGPFQQGTGRRILKNIENPTRNFIHVAPTTHSLDSSPTIDYELATQQSRTFALRFAIEFQSLKILRKNKNV